MSRIGTAFSSDFAAFPFSDIRISAFHCTLTFNLSGAKYYEKKRPRTGLVRFFICTTGGRGLMAEMAGSRLWFQILAKARKSEKYDLILVRCFETLQLHL